MQNILDYRLLLNVAPNHLQGIYSWRVEIHDRKFSIQKKGIISTNEAMCNKECFNINGRERVDYHGKEGEREKERDYTSHKATLNEDYTIHPT